MRWTEQELRDYERRTGRRALRLDAQHEPRPEEPPRSDILILDLTVPPGVNHSYANVPGKGRVLTRQARDWKAGAEAAIAAASLLQGFRYCDGWWMRLSVDCCFLNDNRDLDGVLKITQDALATALGFNDRVVDEVHLRRLPADPVNAHLHIILSTIGLNVQ